MQVNHPPPPVLPGFEHIERSWNAIHGNYLARIKPGEYYVTRHEEGILTLLGSCISACIRDPDSGIGGMNHFMLPSVPGHEPPEWVSAGIGAATRYGNHAMEHLINEIMKNAKNGCKRQNLEVKIFGGSRIIKSMSDIGIKNIRFIRDYLSTEQMRAAAEDVGNIFPRTIIYFPATGLVRVKCLRTLPARLIAERESSYMESVANKPVAGAMEFF